MKASDDKRDLSGPLPWTQRCFVCGEQNPHGLRQKAEIRNGRVLIRYTPREADLGYRNIVHGGIGMTLLDEVMTWAGIVDLGGACVAVDIHVRLRGPIRVGSPLVIAGWITRSTSRLLLTAGSICTEDGSVLMEAEGKYMPMGESEALLNKTDFVADPQTIPIETILGD